MFKIIKRIGNRWWIFLIMLITTLGNVYFDFCIPNQLGSIISTLSSPQPETILIFSDCLWMLLYALLSACCAIATGRLASYITSYVVNKSRYEVFKKVSAFTNAEINKYSVSSLLTRTTNDMTLVSNTLNLAFRYIIYGPLVCVMAIVILIVKAFESNTWALTFIVLGGVIFLLIFVIILVKVALPKYESIQGKLDKVALVTRENLEGLRVVRAYNAEKYQEEKFARNNTDLMKTESISNKLLGLLTPGIQLIMGLINVGLYYFAAQLVQDGALEYASLSVIIQFAALILIGFVMLVVVVIRLPRAVVCARRINEVIEQDISVVGKESTPERTERGTIEFRNVTFKYPGAEVPVLENISFKVKQGETIAFIGATGAGKTTLINLMPRLFDCTEGEVLIDGINVKEYKTEDLNRVFGLVPQKGYLFHDTLKNNICIGKPNASSVDIERALEISQSTEFVSKLPGQLDYEISQGGKNVSGGQRQRLCIARAIIMDPEIFIFDDSFSALDYRTDKVLRGEIKKQCVGVTNVIVGQRVGTIMGADQIVVLDGGKMAGIGTHAELLKNCAVYKEIALSQLSKEELENGK